MAGVKGRSGRRSYHSEVQKGNLLDTCTNWIINNFDSFDKETKVKVALTIAQKGIVQKLEHSGEFTFSHLLKEISNTKAIDVPRAQANT